MKNYSKIIMAVCLTMATQNICAVQFQQSNKTNNRVNSSSLDNFLNTKIPSGSKVKAGKTKNTKVKKYPGYYDMMNNGDNYPEYGEKKVVNGKNGRYYLWENGVRGYFSTQEMVFPDGTIRKKDGKIYKADGTQVNEYGVVIKGAKKIKPVIDAEKGKDTESVDDFLNTKIP